MANTVPAPAGMPALGDLNNQSARADARKAGYYIDASGVYAPGSGQRVQNTFSGSMAGQNTAPSPTQLPIINGTPVSPSNGSTGPQTGAIMYRSDPQYSQYFGPGTPGYTSTSQTYNATPTAPEPAQQSLAAFNTAQGTPTAPNGAPATAPAPVGPAPVTNAQNVPATVTAPVQTAANAADAVGSTDNNAAFQAGIAAPSESGTGFGPYATSEAPALTNQGTYTENGKIIQKSVDQFGNPYFQQVGAAAPAQAATPATGAPTAPGAPAPAAGKPAPTVNPEGKPADPIAPMSTLALPDGSGTVQVPADQLAGLQAHFAQIATNLQQAKMFQQGIDQGRLNYETAAQVATQAYQKALTDGNAAALAETIARDAMTNEINKQTNQIAAAAQAATAQYQQGQLEQQRSATAQTNAIELQKLEAQRQATAQTASTEREKLDLQRQTSRGRRLPQVRYA